MSKPALWIELVGLRSPFSFRQLAGAICGLLVTASSVTAQSTWNGPYVGGYFGGAFQAVHFSVDDPSQPPAYRPVTGATSHGLAFGGLAGFDKLVNKKLVIGFEGGFGFLRYQGDTEGFGVGADTVAATEGGVTWQANVHFGFPIRQVMPFVSLGVLGSKHVGSISDDCDVPPCGSSRGSGTGDVWDTRFVPGFGLTIAGSRPLGGHAWFLRFEWLATPGDPVVNAFSRTVSGVGIPAGTTVPVEIRSDLPAGMLMATFGLRFGR